MYMYMCMYMYMYMLYIWIMVLWCATAHINKYSCMSLVSGRECATEPEPPGPHGHKDAWMRERLCAAYALRPASSAPPNLNVEFYA